MYEKLNKNALKCMYIATVISSVIGMVIIAIVWSVVPDKWFFADVIAAVLALIIVFNMLISPWFRYNRYRYKIDEECIDIEEGYLFVERNIVPIERLHKLEINRGPIDRLCKVSKVKVTTAGGDVVIRFLDEKKAEIITEGLKTRINDIVREEKRD